MIQPDAALEDHLFQVSQAKPVGQIPTHAQENDGLVKMSAFEHCDLPPTHAQGEKVQRSG